MNRPFCGVVERVKSLPGAPLTLELPGEQPREGPDPPTPQERKGLPGREPEGWSDLVVRFWHGEGSTELETLWRSSVLPACRALGRETFALVT